MKKKVKNRVAKRTERKLKREEGTIDASVCSVNQRHNIIEGKSPYAKRQPREDFGQTTARIVKEATEAK
jgi:hypothetical protein